MAVRRLRGDDLENSLNRGALWAVTYGDLMSYLMILFLVLFTSAMSKKGGKGDIKYEKSLIEIQRVFGGKGSSPAYEASVNRDREESMVQQLREAVDKSNLSQFAKVESWDKKIRLVLSDKVLFESGEAGLRPQSNAVLDALADQLKTLPNPLVIEGHTDNVPIRGGRYGSNWELSMARAYAVLKEFEKRGVPASRLAGIGYGEHHPIADNATPAGRAANRRIEIDLIRGE